MAVSLKRWESSLSRGSEMDRQMVDIRAGLHFADPSQQPRMAVYDIKEFIY